MTYSELRKSSSCDAVVFRDRPLDIVCLTVWNGTHATIGQLGKSRHRRIKKQRRYERLAPKSNVAMNACLPQASYPCGNFSDTSSFKFRRFKGSLGHAFTVPIRTGNQNQKSFYPSVPQEISVLVELILGHQRYLLTDVLPQPNSPPNNVFRPDRPTERAFGTKGGALPRFRFTE
ncbi:Regulator of rDNA transcription protein 15 [Capsicum baccatum]|uniref:Regulator of rDNA transcription protein 15 n=1 Tax=Capsicum baccatum TaxID=33114 RepID=A0A2G2V2N5_CAPBA|nr:Regulator of rDNA transcription protein 15 [Capsicum baccatum]